MRVSRIYIDAPISGDGPVELPDSSRHYLVNVLRLRMNNRVIIFNGDGNEYLTVIKEASTKRVVLEVESQDQPDRESNLHIELGQSISRGERMDFVLQKAVELGVCSVTPLWTDRCQVHLDRARLAKRLAHWHGVINSACEQSGRVRIPSLHAPTHLHDWLPPDITALQIVLDPESSASIAELTTPGKLRILVGPEGGLTPAEIGEAVSNGFIRVRLGPRILRTETAALAALTTAQALWGDLTK